MERGKEDFGLVDSGRVVPYLTVHPFRRLGAVHVKALLLGKLLKVIVPC